MTVNTRSADLVKSDDTNGASDLVLVNEGLSSQTPGLTYIS